MKVFIIILILIRAPLLSAQPSLTGHTRVLLSDPDRNNREIPLEVFYPSDTFGIHVKVSDSPFRSHPVVCFAHGYIMKPEAYKNIVEMLVPEGFIVVFPDTETEMFPSHTEFALDIRFISRHFPLLNIDSASIFHERIDTSLALMGHSMGGGCAVLAAENNPEVDALVTLSALETKPSAISSSANIYIPSLVIAGSRDRVTRPEKHQLPMYRNLKSKEKTFINITGGSHCQMAMHDRRCRFGELSLFNNPGIDRETQHRILEKYLVPWLRFQLMGDKDSGRLFNEGANDPEIEFIQPYLNP
ncbi:MAG: dienelactone hydrolase family protein [Bacteroidales bacterium]|nr:dienelactone hydrolase family protein [Bacteroidales bacterium]